MFDEWFDESLGSQRLKSQELREITHSPYSYKGKESLLNGIPSRSGPDKDTKDIIDSSIYKILPSFDLRKLLEVETRKTVKRQYKELYKNGFTRLGRKKYKEGIVSLYTYTALIEYSPKEVSRELREFAWGLALAMGLGLYFGIDSPKKRRDKYGDKDNDHEAWHKVFKTDLDRQEISTLLERAEKIKKNKIREKAEQSGLINKNCFSLCAKIYSLKMLGRADGHKYLKTDEEIINTFGVPRRTFKRRMTDLYMMIG